MEPLKHQIYLVKKKTIRFNWASSDYRFGNAILFAGNLEEFMSSVKSCNDENTLGSTFSAIPNATTGRLSVEMLACYVESQKSYKVSMEFKDTILNSFRSSMASPKLSIQASWFYNQFGVSEIDLATTKTVEKFRGAKQIALDLNEYTSTIGQETIKYSILIKWTTPQIRSERKPCNVLETLFTNKVLADCVIVAAEQKEVKCHRCVLAANSDAFHAMLTSGLEESQTNVIRMSDVAEDVVNELVAFLYGQVIQTGDKSEYMAFELLRIAHMYNILSLETLMLEELLQKDESSFNMNTALDLYFFTRNIEKFKPLCEKMVDVMRKRPVDLDSSSTYQDLFEKEPKEAAILAMKLFKLGAV